MFCRKIISLADMTVCNSWSYWYFGITNRVIIKELNQENMNEFDLDIIIAIAKIRSKKNVKMLL